jgi:hypothetical protein
MQVRYNKCWRIENTVLGAHDAAERRGHFLGSPGHLQTLPFRFSEFIKPPSAYYTCSKHLLLYGTDFEEDCPR